MLTKYKIKCTDLLDLQRCENDTIEHFEFHLKRHPEKSVQIDKILDNNILIVKVLDLEYQKN